MENLLNSLEILWFCITFYFTIITQITHIRIFHTYITNFYIALGIKESRLLIILVWIMWFYQIYFWFHYFKII
jgi:hypothetical protein